jgi:3-oxoacyl-[acyl-carrier protein] reductase
MSKKAIISGATRGIGKAVAYTLAKNGYSLALISRSRNDLKSMKLFLEKQYENISVSVFVADMSNTDEVKEVAGDILQKFGTPDILVNNETGTVSTEKSNTLEKMMNINFFSAYYLTLPFLKNFKKNKKGNIVNICSIVCKEPRAEAASYSISKNALYAYTKVLNDEMRAYNVKVTAIIPGSVNTSSWEGVNAPKTKFVQPEDVASALMNILSNSSGAVTDEIILRPIDRKY